MSAFLKKEPLGIMLLQNAVDPYLPPKKKMELNPIYLSSYRDTVKGKKPLVQFFMALLIFLLLGFGKFSELRLSLQPMDGR
jgi:hypothetical protein